MSTIIKVGNSYNIPIKEYYCDTQEEFEFIKNKCSAPTGSRVYILNGENNEITVMVKSVSEWVVESQGGGSSPSINYPWAHNKEGF